MSTKKGGGNLQNLSEDWKARCHLEWPAHHVVGMSSILPVRIISSIWLHTSVLGFFLFATHIISWNSCIDALTEASLSSTDRFESSCCLLVSLASVSWSAASICLELRDALLSFEREFLRCGISASSSLPTLLSETALPWKGLATPVRTGKSSLVGASPFSSRLMTSSPTSLFLRDFCASVANNKLSSTTKTSSRRMIRVPVEHRRCWPGPSSVLVLERETKDNAWKGGVWPRFSLMMWANGVWLICKNRKPPRLRLEQLAASFSSVCSKIWLRLKQLFTTNKEDSDPSRFCRGDRTWRSCAAPPGGLWLALRHGCRHHAW